MRKAGVICLLICSVLLLFFAVAKDSAASAANTLIITDFYGEIEAYNETGEQIQHELLQGCPINIEDSNIFMDVVRVVLKPEQGAYYEYSLQEDRKDFIFIADIPTTIHNVEYLTIRKALAYSVTFCYPEGDAHQQITQVVVKGNKAQQPPDPTPAKDGEFLGWQETSSTELFDFDTPINRDYTLLPIFDTPPKVDEPLVYAVTFDVGLGECMGGNTTQRISHGTDAQPPQVQPPTGYTFEGWDKDWQNITADTYISAVYRIVVCKVNFCIEGNVCYTTELDYASSIPCLALQAAAEHIPTGRYLDYWSQDGSTPYTFDAIEAAELNLYAVLKICSYTVYFELGDGTTDSDITAIQQTILHGSDALPPIPIPPIGYTFEGWDKDYNNITENITITAIYQIIVCSVSFYYNSGLLLSHFVNYGKQIANPNTTTIDMDLPQGHYLSGWTADGLTLYDFSMGITSSIRFDAVLARYKYEVKFFDGDKLLLGDEYKIEVEHGDCLVDILPTAPPKANATFVCWMATPVSDRPYNSQQPVTAAISLYAKYKALHYTVFTQVSSGITVQTSDQYAQEGQEITFCYTLPEGYTIQSMTLCWLQNEQALTGDSFVMPPSDVTLKLELSPQKYTVSIITDGNIVHISYGENYTPDEPQPPDHHLFEGWYTDSDCTQSFCGKCKADYGESVRLYPKFAKKSYDITFIYGYGGTISLTQSIQYGDYPTPPTPQQTEYLLFVGWDSPIEQAEGDTVYNANYKVLFDIYYYAEDVLLLTAKGELGKPEGDIAPPKDGYDFVGFVIDNVDTTTHKAYYRAVYTKRSTSPEDPALPPPETTTPKNPLNEEGKLQQTEQQVSQSPSQDTHTSIITPDKWQLLIILMIGFVGIKLLSDYISKKKSSTIILP